MNGTGAPVDGDFGWLDEIPRALLGHWPTPLEPLDRLSEQLGGPRIWVKRDDCSGLATGGNKTRKLEYALAEARAQGLERVLTFGAVQSNHARQAAAACARLGLECHLLLSRRVPWSHPGYEKGGNLLLDQLFGATVTVADLDEVDRVFDSLLSQLGGQEAVYVMPAGGSSATGALGYVRCAAELQAQSAAMGVDFDALYHASASAGTQAGLLTGLAAGGAELPVVGVNVFHRDPQTLKARIARLCGELQTRYGVAVPESAIQIEHGYLGAGYGLPGREQLDAIELTARLEGLLFDPVYSGKALHALVQEITHGHLDEHSNVLLMHTGGVTAWGVYDDAVYQTGR
ncbi:MAG: D-cysteine desulfhydrase family protein [Pseudomonadota bacterium]